MKTTTPPEKNSDHIAAQVPTNVAAENTSKTVLWITAKVVNGVLRASVCVFDVNTNTHTTHTR
jgi:hypothetical protein